MRDAIRVLILDREPERLRSLLSNCSDFEIEETESLKDLAERKTGGPYDVAIYVSNSGGSVDLQLLDVLQSIPDCPPIILVSDRDSARDAAVALKRGVFDYVVSTRQQLSRLPDAIREAAAGTTHCNGAGQGLNGMNNGTSDSEIKGLAARITQRTVELRKANKQLGAETQGRKHIEDALRVSEARYRTLVDHAHDGIAIVYDGLMAFVSQRLSEMLDYSVEDMVGRPFVDFIAPEVLAQVQDHYQRRLAGEEVPKIYESTILKHDGTALHVEFSVGIIPFGSGKASLVVIRDITDRMNTHRALRESEERLELALEGAGLGMWDQDFRTDTVVRSARWAEMLGYSLEEIDRDPDAWRNLIHPDDLSAVMSQAKDHEAGRIPEFRAEHRMLAKDGSWRWILNWGRVVERDSDDQPVRATGIHLDITERKLAGEALRKSEERLSSVIDKSPIPTAVGGADGTIVSFNEALEELIGYSRDEIADVTDWTKKLYPDKEYRDFVWKNIQQALNGEEQYCTEFVIIRKDGSTRTVNFHTSFFDGGLIIQMVDISDRVETQRALKESEVFNRAVIEHSPLGISVRDRTGRLLSYNRAWQEFWNLSEEDIEEYKNQSRDHIAFDERDNYLGQWLPQVQSIYKKGGYLSVPEVKLSRHRSGETRWASQHFYAICDIAGEVDRVVILTEDITERIEAENALRESESLLKLALEGVNDGLWDLNPKTGEAYFSPRWFTMIGYEPNELPPVYDSWAQLLHPDDLELTEAKLQSFLKEESETYAPEYRMRDKSGQWRWVQSRGEAVEWDDDGDVVRIVGIHTDITERKEAEARERSAVEERLEQAKRISEVFAHEIRNALFPAAAALNLLKSKAESDDNGDTITEYAKIAERAVTKAAGTTRLITAFNKLDSELMPERVEFDSVVNEFLADNRLRIDSAGVEVQANGPEKLWVKSNRRQLSIVLNNLLLNGLVAVQGIPESKLELRWSKDNDRLCVILEDNGHGVQPENIDKLFEPFFTTKSESGGIGIGLATVKKILEMYDGSIELTQTSEKGTIFTLYFELV